MSKKIHHFVKTTNNVSIRSPAQKRACRLVSPLYLNIEALAPPLLRSRRSRPGLLIPTDCYSEGLVAENHARCFADVVRPSTMTDHSVFVG
jgi:hypothetical protein